MEIKDLLTVQPFRLNAEQKKDVLNKLLRNLILEHEKGCLEYKRKRAIGVYGDDHGDDETPLFLRLRVELLAELHDINAVLAQGRSHRWRGVCLSRGALKLYLCYNLLRHMRLQLPLFGGFLHLREILLDGRRPPEDAHHHPELALRLAHVVNDAGEV